LSLELVNGASDSVSIPDPSGALNPTDAFTVEFWMKAEQDQPEDLSVLVDHSHGFTDATGWAVQAVRSTGKIDFAIGNGTAFPSVLSEENVLDGMWHHVAGTFDIADVGQEIKLYIDGELEGTAASGGPLAPNSRNVNIGRSWSNTVTRFYNGLIDEVRISNVALSPHSLLLTSPIPGDFNRDDIVDAADYIVWRKGFATGAFTQDDYNTWRANFGATAAGAAAVAQPPIQSAIPEPTALALGAIALVLLVVRRK
jgi:hypothetical protein